MQALPVLIHYVGDEQHFRPGPHGNSKHETSLQTPFQKTLPSLITTMKKGLQDHDPAKFYKGAGQFGYKPRNSKQCSNFKQVYIHFNTLFYEIN